MRQSRRGMTGEGQGAQPSRVSTARPGTALPLEGPLPTPTLQAPEFPAEGSAGKAGLGSLHHVLREQPAPSSPPAAGGPAQPTAKDNRGPYLAGKAAAFSFFFSCFYF